MSAESDLITALEADSTLNAVITGRLEPAPRRLNQTAPDLTWKMYDRTFEQAIDRSVAGKKTFYQFDAWASSELNAEAVVAALKTALLAYTTAAHSLELLSEGGIPEPNDSDLCHWQLTCSILT